MTPPKEVPGIPGMRLVEPWERRVLELERRVGLLEQNDSTTRAQLQSYTDEEEDSQVKIPSDAPPKVKAGLGALQGIPPNQRGIVVVLVALIVAVAIVVLVHLGQKLF